MQRRPHAVAHVVHLGVFVEQQPYYVDVTFQARVKQRRALGRAQVDVGALVHQPLHHGPPAFLAYSRLQSRLRLLVMPLVHIRPMLHQQLHHVEPLCFDGKHQRRAAWAFVVRVALEPKQLLNTLPRAFLDSRVQRRPRSAIALRFRLRPMFEEHAYGGVRAYATCTANGSAVVCVGGSALLE